MGYHVQIINTTEKFGILTKSLHWLIFLLVVTEFFLVYRREYFPKGSLEKSQYMMLHKSFGVCILLLALLMLVSRYIGRHPRFPGRMTHFQVMLAKWTHFLLYAFLFIQPITGILMSTYAGYKVSVFNLFELPLHLPKHHGLSEIFESIHVFSSYFIIGLVALHIFAAFYHQFVEKDNVLKRML